MALISKKDAEVLSKEFETGLVNPVKLLMFTQTIECQFCAETRQIAEEVAALSDKVTVQILNFVEDKDRAEQYGIDKIPAIAIVGVLDGQDRDYGIRFYGIPSGYEFTSLIEDIVDVSRGETSLKAKTREALAGMRVPVHIQVFVTPTCPYCTMAVRLAHQFAIESDLVRADAVEAIEFPHLAQKYRVQGVPRIVFNEKVHQEGAVPEPVMLAKLLESIAIESDEAQAEAKAQDS